MRYTWKALSTELSAQKTVSKSQLFIINIFIIIQHFTSTGVDKGSLDETIQNFRVRLKWFPSHIKIYHHKWNYTCIMYLECLPVRWTLSFVFLYTASHSTVMPYASWIFTGQFHILFHDNKPQLLVQKTWSLFCPVPVCLSIQISLKQGSSEGWKNWGDCFRILAILKLGNHR